MDMTGVPAFRLGVNFRDGPLSGSKGILELRIPKGEAAKGKRIAVKSTSACTAGVSASSGRG
jgi:hypothetical protein